MIILYKQENNIIAMLNPSEDFSIEEAVKQVPIGSEYRIIDPSDLPSDQYLSNFSDALRIDFNKNGKEGIDFDITIAREITKQRLRKERMPFFIENDVLLRDSQLENDHEKLLISIKERNRLRDLPSLVDTITNLDHLLNLHP